MSDKDSINIRVTNKVNVTEKFIDAAMIFGALFVGLKLTGISDVAMWPWSVVLLPLYVLPLVIICGFVMVSLVGAVVVIIRHIASALGTRRSKIEVTRVRPSSEGES